MISSRTPSAMAGMISCGRFCIGTSSADREGDREDGADGTAVDGEWCQPVGLEEAQQKLDGEVGGDGRADRPDEGLPADVVALRAEELRQLENPGGSDDRRRK